VATPSAGLPTRPRGHLFDRFVGEVSAAALPAGSGDERVVSEADLAGLPSAVQRYLRFMGSG
jgi:hypothetical protein